MSALSQPEVGDYLNRHFVSAFQKVGTFQLAGGQKQGGNVASYFCTPTGRVLHALAGPVNAAVFKREVQWANETYQLALLEHRTQVGIRLFFRRAHRERLEREHGIRIAETRLPELDQVTSKLLDDVLSNHQTRMTREAQLHLLLAVGASPRLETVYRIVFERILNERVSTSPVAGR